MIRTGYIQPFKIYCPKGHYMKVLSDPFTKTLESGDDMIASCFNSGCEHYLVYFKVILPQVELEEKYRLGKEESRFDR